MNPLELSGGGFDATFHALTVAADAWEPEDYVPEITQRGLPVKRKEPSADKPGVEDRFLLDAKALKQRADATSAEGDWPSSLKLWIMSGLRFYQSAFESEKISKTKARTLFSQTGTFLTTCAQKVQQKEPKREALLFYVAGVCFGRAFQVCRKEVRKEHRVALGKFREGQGAAVPTETLLKLLEAQNDVYKAMECVEQAKALKTQSGFDIQLPVDVFQQTPQELIGFVDAALAKLLPQ